MPNATFYPVFEPDQVLTDTNLNNLFAYLDQQDHLTRNKLIGIGIVCGLHTSWSGSTITITKGVGITSLGYLLHFEGGVYSHFRPYTLPDFPQTIDPAVHALYDSWPMQLLIPATQPKEADDKALPANTDLLKTHAVVLLLEPWLSDLKNCTTNDCNDKGKQVDITVRPVLVPRNVLQQYKYFGRQQQKFNFPLVHLQRWNVPARQIQHPINVVQAFDAVLNSRLIRELDAACRFVYDVFSPLFESNGDDTVLNQVYNHLIQLVQSVRKNNTVHYQYLYDHVDDLIRAYNDFREVVFDVLGECCPDENLFPLHLMLGEADQSSALNQTAFRHYFIYSPLFNQQQEKFEEARSLYNRLVLMLEQFQLPGAEEGPAALPIRITPSVLGDASLGKRCIPYYYKPQPLFSFWDYQKSRKGRAALNYGYFADIYSNDIAAVQPLLYDTEPYNFFRIEGHAGRPVNTVLRNLAAQKLHYNLPFDVVALNLYPNSTLNESEKLRCYFSDLESHYNVLLSELLCKLHGLFCAAGKWPFNQQIYDTIFPRNATIAFDKEAVNMNRTFFRAGAGDAAGAEEENFLKTDTLAATPNLTATSFTATFQVLQLAAINFVDRTRRINPYKKGTYLRFFCKPDTKAETVATYYLNWLNANPGKRWPKPGPVNVDESNSTKWMATLYLHFFYLIDSIEEMLGTLLPFDLNQVNYTRFKNRYDEVMEEVEDYAGFFDNLYHAFDMINDKKDLAQNKPFDLIQEEMEDWAIDKAVTKLTADSRALLMSCFDDRLQQLQFEYRKRVAYILEQHIFSNYARLKTGLEHKAGVPKGGTFVLLYFDRPGNRETPDTRNAAAENVIPGVAANTASFKASKATDEEKLEQNIQGIQKIVELNKEEFASAELLQFQQLLTKVQALPASAETMQIPEGVVFADLYIPYMCCSECAPTAFVFQEPVDESPQPDIDIKTTSFCNHQDIKEPVTVTPEGGTVTGQGIIQESGQYFFNPKGLAEGSYPLTYKLNEKTDTVIVTVTATPDPEFNFLIKGPDATGGGVVVAFSANAQNGFHNWNFGDNTAPATQANPEHTFFFAGVPTATFNVTHSVTNGNCSLPPVTKPVTISIQTPVELGIKKNPLCVNDVPERLLYQPAGGVMTCKEKAAAIANIGGFFHFAPAAAGIGKYTVQYELNGTSREISIDVLPAPTAEFEAVIVSSTATAVTVKFTAKQSAGSHQWKFNDGQQSTEANPTMTFKQTASAPLDSIAVTHTVSGDVCSDSISKDIPLGQSPQIMSSTRTLCYQVKPVALETGLATDDTVQVVNNGGHKLDTRARLTLNASTPVGQSTVKVRYRVTSGGQTVEKQVDITVNRLNETIKISFTRSTVTMEADADTAAWTIYRDNNTANTIVQGDTHNPLTLKTAQLPGAMEIGLNIDIDISRNGCKSTLRKTIPASQYNQLIQSGGVIEI
jgi:PKD repeat protein